MTNRKETANPSSEKMTTIARVIGLKGMPIGKTLVGSLLQPRDHRDTRRKCKNSVYMPNFKDQPNETIRYIWDSRQPGLLRPFLWASMLNMARFKPQFNHDFPLSNGMEHGAVRVRPKNGSRFII